MVALLYIDLDHFKPVNDTYGHEAGDEVLCEVSRRLESGVRESDTIARFGGDEFIVLLQNIQKTNDAERMARMITRDLSKPFPLKQGVTCTIGSSIGISIYPNDGLDAETLLLQADNAMYKVKQDGRSGYQLATNMDKVPFIADL